MKRLRLQIAEAAAGEIRDARQWWQANRLAARGAFTEDLRQALKLIRDQPGVGAHAMNVDQPGVRKLHLRRLRYDLYYRLSQDQQSVIVLALWHSSRGSGPSL